ncbi:MAG: magnesium/cobalt transporter CorA [Flavobacteriaceae bacterium]|nr:magnesium/cobalt transporter CorA [Flavobacteriaceae bacterium]
MAQNTKTHIEDIRKIGLPPGTLKHVGKVAVEKVKITVIDYFNEQFQELEIDKISDAFAFKESTSATWINVDGLHDTNLISEIGTYFGIHNLTLEDILNTNHRPKLEDYDDYLFLTLKMLAVNSNNHVESEQVSLVLGKNWLITFQEAEGDLFDKIRVRLRDSQGKIRQKGVDYLFYALIDIIVDNYFVVTEHFKDEIEIIEDKVLLSPDKRYLTDIQKMRNHLIDFRKAIVPLREALGDLRANIYPLISKKTNPYLSDVYEHTLYLYESTEYLQESLTSILDLYHSGISNKTNQIMQVLTIISTIFIPLTFIVGVYGMNFEFFPEIHWKYGYLFVWIFMIIIVLGMMRYFRNKKWL